MPERHLTVGPGVGVVRDGDHAVLQREGGPGARVAGLRDHVPQMAENTKKRVTARRLGKGHLPAEEENTVPTK